MLNFRKQGLVLAAVLALAAWAVANRAPASGASAHRLSGQAANAQGAATAVYQIDPAHSTIGFAVRHLMINNVLGRFNEFAGKINYDAADITRSAVEFTAKTASVDTGVARRDNHLRTPDFFDVQQYPEMTFKSTKVERKGNDAYIVHGTFSLHGVSKEIAIPFKLFGPIKDPQGKQRLGVEAGLTINRQDYGIKYNSVLEGGGLAVGNDVQITLLLEAIKQ
jgi:polyisoprenoid-binding protein YceI